MNRQKERTSASEADSAPAANAAPHAPSREGTRSDLSASLGALLADASRARLIDFGPRDYAAVLALQERLREARLRDEIPDTWLFGEHPTVVTQGVRAQATDLATASDQSRNTPERAEMGGLPLAGPVAGSILGPNAVSVGGADAATLVLTGPLAGVPVVKIDRGGMTTLHSPGQMILYPIVKLREGSLSAGRMAQALLDGMRRWLRDTHGVESEIPPGRPGLFVDGRKLLSVGISARGGVTMHGIAMNLSNDLDLWNGIVACGEPGTHPISLSDLLGRSVDVGAQKTSIMAWLATEWGYAEVGEAAGT